MALEATTLLVACTAASLLAVLGLLLLLLLREIHVGVNLAPNLG